MTISANPTIRQQYKALRMHFKNMKRSHGTNAARIMVTDYATLDRLAPDLEVAHTRSPGQSGWWMPAHLSARKPQDGRGGWRDL